jgi:hypothetical protein
MTSSLLPGGQGEIKLHESVSPPAFQIHNIPERSAEVKEKLRCDDRGRRMAFGR